MEKENLIIAFCGEALKNHEIEIEELAVALTGMAGIIKQAGAIANKGQRSKIKVQVSSLEAGSFEIHLVTSQVSEFLNLWGTNPQLVGLSVILGLLGFGGLDVPGVIQLIKTLKNNKIKKAEELTNNDIKITYIDNGTVQHITINKYVYDFYNDSDIREAFCKVISPLKSDGIDKMEIRDSSGNVKETIKKEEAGYFDNSMHEDILVKENIDEMWLSFISISFRDGNKWRFAYGSNVEFYATIEDIEFLNEVSSNKLSFSKSDAVRAKVKTSQFLTDKGMRNEYTVIKILEYKSIRQLRLDFYGENDNNQS